MDKKLLLLFACLLFLSCDKDDKGKITTLTIASEKGVVELVGVRPCYFVKFKGSDVWSRTGSYIFGFDYQPGYEYVIKVVQEEVKNPPEDYVANYRLIKIISKVQKNSENLPPPVPWEQ